MKLGWDKRLMLGACACAGVAAAHVLAYRLAVPDHHERAEVLLATGHGYWPLFVAVALGVLVAAFARIAIRPAPYAALARRFAPNFLRLTLLQVGGFVALEITERAFAGGLEGLLAEAALGIGIALQALIAAFGALLLAAFIRIVTWLRAEERPITHATNLVFPTDPCFVTAPQLMGSGFSWRGPPATRC